MNTNIHSYGNWSTFEASFNIRSKQGNTPLIAAVNNNQYEMAKTLILNGADVNASNKEGETALLKAKSLHNDQMTQLLIENGAQL